MERWLKCRIFKGMFHDERAVQCSNKDGSTISVFVPSAKVDGQPDQDGLVRVLVYHRGNTAWAILPTEHSAAIPVSDDDLVPA